MIKLPRIVFLADALLVGGAETFVLRLAAAFRKRGLDVSIFVLRGDLVGCEQVYRLAGDIPLMTARVPALRWLMLLDGLLFRIGIKFSFLRWVQILGLRKYLFSVRPDIVHSHLITSDLVASRACSSLGIRWVSTMHGDYLALEERRSSSAARIPDFVMALREIERTVSHIICITEQQQSQLSRLLPSLGGAGSISKIYNGYGASDGDLIDGGVPEALSKISVDDFVIGMVARGIREKGWEVMLAAFQELNLPNSWLVLVGDGDYLNSLKGQVRHPQVVFTGNVVDPLRYIARFDVGCLPSRIPTESLPTVVIEYLTLGKPVVATDVGEVAKMINADGGGSAGLLIELDSVEAMTRQMKLALERIYWAPAERARLQENALIAACKFDMGKCVDAYLAIYRSAQG